jgi:hypothetical protein
MKNKCLNDRVGFDDFRVENGVRKSQNQQSLSRNAEEALKHGGELKPSLYSSDEYESNPLFLTVHEQ